MQREEVRSGLRAAAALVLILALLVGTPMAAAYGWLGVAAWLLFLAAATALVTAVLLR